MQSESKTHGASRQARALIQLLTVTFMLGFAACDDDETVSVPQFHSSPASVPTMGPDVPGSEPFDAEMKALLYGWNVAGATLAVAKDGRLILARGYGFADYESRQPMQPDATMRVASVSKFVTTIAILQLKDQGRLALDDRAFDILDEYRVAPGGDPRVLDITVRHLLQHSGGWDRFTAGDPLFQHSINAGMFEISLRVSCEELIQAAMSMPLQFAPGTRSRYSNLGFCILGRVIEKVTGQPYEIYVRDSVLAPIGVHAMSIGYERMSERGPFEPKYYPFDGEQKVPSIFPGEGLVPAPYGLFDLRAGDATGGWIASAVDLARVMSSVDGSRGTPVISSASLEEMVADPNLSDYADPNYWAGLGVGVGPTPTTWFKNGLLPGTKALVVHNRYGYNWIVLANGAPRDIDGFESAIVAAIVAAFEVHGPGGFAGSASDLFAQFPSPPLPARHQ